MCTLMSTGNSSGKTGRCDAKCYGASGGTCHCCCGGRNHGKGLNKAIDNIQDYADQMIKDWERLHPDERILVKAILF